jgi:hypothetical protein
MTLPLPRPGPSNYQDEPGFELDLLWDQAADAIEATYAEVTAHLANTSNPHSVTKAQVGLGSVDNTADTNKPVSTAQAAADTAIGSAAASDATTKANSAQAAAIAACPAETATTIGALTAGATTKATPVDADVIGLSDSAASNVLKKLSWANLKTALQSVFATLAGTSGGQTLRGGTAASETLTLQSTASATKGKILFGTSAYDEVNNRLGIGQTSPSAALHLKSGGTGASTAPIKFTSGPYLTDPEAGAIEYNAGTFSITNATPVRRQIATEQYLRSRGLSLVTNGTGLLNDNTNFSGYTFDRNDTYAGAGSFMVNLASSTRLSDELIPVLVSQRYRLSLYAKSGDIGGGNYSAANRQYFGLALYDIDGLTIGSQHADRIPSAAVDTTLGAALNPGDTTVTLTNATGWQNAGSAAGRQFCWYGYTNSFGYTYPDYTYTRLVSSLYPGNASLGTWNAGAIVGNVITLRVPWAGPALASGTSVRCTATGNTYKYIALSNALVPNSWTRYEGYIEGLQVGGVASNNKFRDGTAYVTVLALVNYHGSADNNVRLSWVALTEISSANMEPQVGVGSTYKSLLQSELPTNGLVVEGRLGVGTSTPSGCIHAVSTTEQLRIGYDSSNYLSATVASDGSATLAATGGTVTLQGTAATDGPTLGSELLTSAGWTVTAGWTESPDDTFAHAAASGTAALTHSATISSATRYQVSWTVTGRTAGSFTVAVGGQSQTTITATGAFGPSSTSTAALTVTPTTDFDGTISLLSCKNISTSAMALLLLRSVIGAVYEQRTSANPANMCTFLGYGSGRFYTTGVRDTSVGAYTQYNITSGGYDTAVGTNAQYSLTTGNYDTAVGTNAQYSLTTGNYDTAVGANVQYFVTTGSFLTGQGINAQYSLTTGSFDTAVGSYAQYGLTTGSSDTAVGRNAQRYLADGVTNAQVFDQCTHIGADSRVSAENVANETAIGYQAIGIGSNTTSIGNLSVTATQIAGNCTHLLIDATTNAAVTVESLIKNVTGAGVGAAGLGPRLIFGAESSTTDSTTQADITATWTDATHATRKSRLTLSAWDTAAREGLRIEGDGSVARLGFYGATAVVKPTALTATVAAAPAGGTGTAAGAWDTSGNRDLAIATINNLKTRVDQLETKLQALGLLT